MHRLVKLVRRGQYRAVGRLPTTHVELFVIVFFGGSGLEAFVELFEDAARSSARLSRQKASVEQSDYF